MTSIRGFFNVENKVPQNMRCGELPSNRKHTGA